MAVKTEKISRSDRSIEDTLAAVNHIPVAAARQILRGEIREHPNFVLIGDTGSGKTTCFGPLLVELKREWHLSGNVAVTQPRKIGATSVTERVSDMMGCEVGQKVGYHIRFDDMTTEETEITFMTDGILLRKIQFDPLLTEYCVVMIDEAHEQTTNILFCLGLLKEVNLRRRDASLDPIHIIVASATIDRNRFAQYIANGDKDNSIEIPGRMFPIEVFYEKETPQDFDFTQGAAEKVKYIYDNKLDGDILIFMPGKREISDTIMKIEALIGIGKADIIPLHAELPPEEQDKIFAPTAKRRITVATNIAETGITPPGKINIIDTGLVKETHFDPKSGIERLICVEASQASVDQRKGRAGRNDSGRCFRLFTEGSYRRRPKYQTSEITRSNLAQVVLAMKKVGIDDVANFDFLDRPSQESIDHALYTLTNLCALDVNGDLSEIGEWMVELALEPRLGRMVIEAAKPNIDCVNEICIIAAFLDGKNVFVRPEGFDEQREADRRHDQFKTDKDSDFVVILNVWKAYVASGYDDEWAKANYLNEKSLKEATNVRLDLLDVLEGHGIHVDSEAKPRINKDALGKAITAGLVGNLMRSSRGSGLKKIDGTKSDISIHPGSILANRSFPEGTLIVSDEIFINPQNKTYACNCLEVKREWLTEVAPDIARSLHGDKHFHKGGSREHHGRHSSHNVYDRHSRRR